MKKSKLSEMSRQEFLEKLKAVVINLKIPKFDRGHMKCPFFLTGCLALFQNKEDVRSHSKQCFYGVFQICKMCDHESGEIFRPLSTFCQHVSNIPDHCIRSTSLLEVHGIDFNFNPWITETPSNGYHLVLLRRFDLSIEEDNFGMVFGIVIQSIGINEHRVILAPITFGLDGNTPHHFVKVQCTIRGRNHHGLEIMPISCPSFNQHNITANTTCRAFNSVQEFIDSCLRLDGVVSYNLQQLLHDHHDSIKINLKLSVFRCEVQEGAEYPIVPFSTTWSELELDERVRDSMDDGGKAEPSEVSSILISQLKGQGDVIIESIDSCSVSNAIMASVLDYILTHVGQRPRDPTGNTLAWIVYPTIAMMKRYVSEWKRRAIPLRINVFNVESNNLPQLYKHIQRVGCDILITVPTILHHMLTRANAAFKEQLTEDVKYVFFAAHSRNCFSGWRQKLQYCTDQLNERNGRILRVAHVACMNDTVRYHSRNMRVEPHQPEASSIFNKGWNFISVGVDPVKFSDALNVQMLRFQNLVDRKNQIIRLIADHGGMKRWLIIGMNPQGRPYTSLLKDVALWLDQSFQDTSRVICVTEEREMIQNTCFWQPFIHRPDAIYLGPYFLLDAPEAVLCDGMILLSAPIHPAEKVRIRHILDITTNQKPLYLFFHDNNDLQ